MTARCRTGRHARAVAPGSCRAWRGGSQGRGAATVGHLHLLLQAGAPLLSAMHSRPLGSRLGRECHERSSAPRQDRRAVDVGTAMRPSLRSTAALGQVSCAAAGDCDRCAGAGQTTTIARAGVDAPLSAGLGQESAPWRWARHRSRPASSCVGRGRPLCRDLGGEPANWPRRPTGHLDRGSQAARCARRVAERTLVGDEQAKACPREGALQHTKQVAAACPRIMGAPRVAVLGHDLAQEQTDLACRCHLAHEPSRRDGRSWRLKRCDRARIEGATLPHTRRKSWWCRRSKALFRTLCRSAVTSRLPGSMASSNRLSIAAAAACSGVIHQSNGNARRMSVNRRR